MNCVRPEAGKFRVIAQHIVSVTECELPERDYAHTITRWEMLTSTLQKVYGCNWNELTLKGQHLPACKQSALRERSWARLTYATPFQRIQTRCQDGLMQAEWMWKTQKRTRFTGVISLDPYTISSFGVDPFKLKSVTQVSRDNFITISGIPRGHVFIIH